jgi:hypothetical protein
MSHTQGLRAVRSEQSLVSEDIFDNRAHYLRIIGFILYNEDRKAALGSLRPELPPTVLHSVSIFGF